jgi:hypothetical protein
MSGSLQTKMYGGHRHSSTVVRKLGSYNGAPVKRLGHYNGPVKRLGVYTGAGASKNNLNMEIYPYH